MSREILFVFAGRQANMELQLPFIRRLLDERPQAEYHVWNLCREEHDNAYVRTIAGRRITIHSELYPHGNWNDVYRHYTDPQYRDAVFVKLDDDVVFLETARFGVFVDAIRANRRAIMSANVINNGACTALIEGMGRGFAKLDIPLLDVHHSAAYAEMAHQLFFTRYLAILNQPVELVPTDDWLSINVIGYDYEMGQRIAHELDKPHPASIAGREFQRTDRLGDEGCVNTFRRIVMRGFTAGHLTFGPQRPTEAKLARWRERYGQIGEAYLSSHQDDGRVIDEDLVLPVSATPDGWRGRHQDSDALAQ